MKDINDIIWDKVTKAKEFKAKGNEYFKENNYKKALLQYHSYPSYSFSGLMYLKGVDCDIEPAISPASYCVKDITLSVDDKDAINTLHSDLENNLAACLLKQNPVRYDRILDCSIKVLHRHPNNLKAAYRSALAYYHLKDYENAKEAVERADKISNGKDSAVRNLKQLISNEIKRERQEDMSLFKNSLLKNSFK